MTLVLILVSFGLLVGGALVFTNAVEWAGVRLGLGEGAVGSVLAAVATAMPESLVPIVALVSGAEDSKEIAVGAIVGAPFLLATLAMALIGLSALGFRRRRSQGERIEAHDPTTRRDLLAFLALFTLAFALGFVEVRAVQLAGAAFLIVAYLVYLQRSLAGGGKAESEDELTPLYLDPTKRDAPAGWQIAAQTVGGVAAIAGGAHLFVHQVTSLADEIGVSALVLTLVLAPLATELPEKLNSVIWAREGKDALALGNVTGAMVFQSTLPVCVGLAFTTWEFDRYASAAAAAALAGAALALWAVTREHRFGPALIATWISLFAAFVVFVAVGAA